MGELSTIKPTEETVLSKLVESIGNNLEEIKVLDDGISKLSKSVSAKYTEKLTAVMETMTVEEIAVHFRFLASTQLAILDAKRKLLIKGLENPSPPQNDMMELFKLVNTPEKRQALESLLKSFEKHDDL